MPKKPTKKPTKKSVKKPTKKPVKKPAPIGGRDNPTMKLLKKIDHKAGALFWALGATDPDGKKLDLLEKEIRRLCKEYLKLPAPKNAEHYKAERAARRARLRETKKKRDAHIAALDALRLKNMSGGEPTHGGQTP